MATRPPPSLKFRRNLVLDNATNEWLVTIAEQDHLSKSSVVRLLVLAEAKRRGLAERVVITSDAGTSG